MKIKILLQHSLLIAGFILLGSVTGKASDGVPTPSQKPYVETVLSPVPTNKPERLQPISQRVAPVFDIPKSEADSTPISIFSDRQARLSREIFSLQDQEKITEADKKIAQLNNKIILGHFLAERYLHPTAYKASYEELARWMAQYSDHPQAAKIYKLALSRKLITARIDLTRPTIHKKISGNLAVLSQKGKKYKSTKRRSRDQQSRVKKLYQDIQKNVRRQQPTLALNILSNDYAVQFMDDVEYDTQRALISSGYLYAGKLNDAERLANASIDRSGANVPLAGWVKGLVEWQRGDYSKAAIAFQMSASSPYASGWLVSASAYWASRAHMRQGDTELVSQWLALSATHPRTFYGLIAIRALGHSGHFNWDVPSLSRQDVQVVESTKQGQRAIALIKSGELGLAEAELKTLNFNGDVAKKESLLAYANHYNLPSLLMLLGNSLSNSRGNFYDAALYPMVSWEPETGLSVDKALMHAIIRQESRFNHLASNPSGATGLMQLMPKTANYVSGKDIYDQAAGRYQLQNPEVNLDLGQRYIEELLDHRAVKNDLMALAIAYNAGPGNLSKWKSERSHITDPLLFIETIPYNETRAFVERVLSNYWIYKMRLNEETPSLDAVAEGKWARYAEVKNSQSLKSDL